MQDLNYHSACNNYPNSSPGLPNGLKGLQPRAPKAEGRPKPRQKIAELSTFESVQFT